MSDNKKNSRRKLFEDIFVFELAFYLFDLLARVVREFFNLILMVIFGVVILAAVMHFLK